MWLYGTVYPLLLQWAQRKIHVPLLQLHYLSPGPCCLPMCFSCHTVGSLLASCSQGTPLTTTVPVGTPERTLGIIVCPALSAGAKFALQDMFAET